MPNVAEQQIPPAVIWYDQPDGNRPDGTPEYGEIPWPKEWPLPRKGDMIIVPAGYECEVKYVTWDLGDGNVLITVDL